ncbi:MAG TPA: T9SS type A sorting domain-containing protein, partial [Ignavibacteriaceae bacterium]|nr:T9SS type A sorting domain-containing protein [Ignavibacteriaceae bacterium]
DENLSSGKYQYRLKQIDFDGSFEYSNTIEVEITAPLEFSLEQNYPNPFNPSTNIKYVISSRQFVTLKIFNSLGEEIETLVNEFQDAGVHSKLYIINSTLPSGVYFYELKAGEFVQTRKMLLLK